METNDITLKRFQEAAHVCGLIPRLCFEAAVSPAMLLNATTIIVNAITKCEDLAAAIFNVRGNRPVPHRAFEIWPSPKARFWDSCHVRPVSDWAFHQIMAELDRRDKDAAYRLYKTIYGARYSDALAKMWETEVHKFFGSITQPKSFYIRSLNDHLTSFDIEFSYSTSCQNFRTEQNFAGQLASFAKNEKSLSCGPFLGISQPGCQPLIDFQITDVHGHPITIKCYADVQECLKLKVPKLKSLRPTMARKWIIPFVVPESKVASFVKQQSKDAEKVGHWDSKTTQYVLGLPVHEVMRS